MEAPPLNTLLYGFDYILAAFSNIALEGTMGVDLIPVFNPEVPEVMPDGDIRMVVTDLEELDAIAKERGVKPLSAFMNDVDEESEEELDDSALEWFPVSEGLKTLQELITALSDDKAKQQFDEAEVILEELQDLRHCLQIGAEQSSQFCFAFV